MTLTHQIAQTLSIPLAQVQAALDLLDSGNTLPFVARYRKEATGGLDEEQLRNISVLSDSLRALADRRQTVLDSIREQGKLTPALEAQILAVQSRTALEDLYQPFRPKRRTRASMAREKGLQPLADLILAQPGGRASAEELARPFVSPEAPTVEEALAGARDIVAETITDHPEVRRVTREKALNFATLTSALIPKAEEEKLDEKSVFAVYYDFRQRVDRLRPHQVLALNRGETEKVLRVGVEVNERDWQGAIRPHFRVGGHSPLAEQMQLAMDDGAARLLLPAIERDVRRTLSEQAEAHAIQVFARNLRALLSQPPLAGRTVLGLDPGFRTGSKAAVVDATGKALDTATIYPHPPQRQWAQSKAVLTGLIRQHGVSLIAIGNGTASRESEQLAAELIKELGLDDLHYIIVNEAGASVYSASPLARAEMPDLDVTLRGAVSIARRVQDPLAELVKIDPKSIGIGLYQHDVNQTELARSLDAVVESVVNQVGVDVNTASPALLTHVAGIGPKLAQNIVAHRDEHGPFPSRKAIKEVTGLGPKAFEQCAGFLRVRDGDNPLDASAIHPESYKVAEAVLKRAGLTASAPAQARQIALDTLAAYTSVAHLAADLGAGVPTLTDILEQLVRPGRDPRADLPTPILRQDVLSLADLLPGLRLPGTVRNVVDFGAFVDIGVKNDGLLHRSQIPHGTVLRVGDVIEVEIKSVEAERGRIGLGWVDG